MFIVTGICFYWRFAKETEIDAGITEKYLAENNIKLTEFYGTSKFQEIEAAIQAKRASYWKTMYVLPIIFSMLSAAAAAVSFIIGRQEQLKNALDAGSAALAGSSLFMFIVSLIRFISADFSHLYLTSESSAWRGLGLTAALLVFACSILLVVSVILEKKGIYFGKPKKASGFNTQDDDDDDNIFYPVNTENEEIDDADEGDDADDADDENN
ncbi:MAG: hypothetical protein MJ177_10945 [Clostridia bacterium]|nr:hypothetical protein [Clostridia bacterium]